MRRIVRSFGGVTLAVVLLVMLPAPQTSALGTILGGSQAGCLLGPPDAISTLTIYGTPGTPTPGDDDSGLTGSNGVVAPMLLGFDVSNPCLNVETLGLHPLDGSDVLIAVLPGTTASLMTTDLQGAGLFPRYALVPGGGFSAGSGLTSDPCVFDPDFILGPEGILVPAVC